MFGTTANGKRFSLTMALALALVVARTKGIRSWPSGRLLTL